MASNSYSSRSPPPLQHPKPTHPAYPPPEPPHTPAASTNSSPYSQAQRISQDGYMRYSSPPVDTSGNDPSTSGFTSYGSALPPNQARPGFQPPPAVRGYQDAGFNTWPGMNDATAQMGVQFGKSAVAAGQDYVEKNFSRYLPLPLVKTSFAVTNSRRSTENGTMEGWQPPREDINAPDLYIPKPLPSPPLIREFHVTSSLGESRIKVQARRKKAKVQAKRAEVEQADLANKPDPILGFVNSKAGPSRTRSDASTPWDRSRLKKTLIRPEDLWYSPVPAYAEGARPTHFLPGLNTADERLLFGALPHVATALKYDPDNKLSFDHLQTQTKQSEMVMRILDLRNASKRGIETVNRQRVIQEFGNGGDSVGKVDCGSSQVQGKHDGRVRADFSRTPHPTDPLVVRAPLCESKRSSQ
ncbi:hypothetical protein P7C73_g4629, partial [Tremellales sp. Uapishka_1]